MTCRSKLCSVGTSTLEEGGAASEAHRPLLGSVLLRLSSELVICTAAGARGMLLAPALFWPSNKSSIAEACCLSLAPALF